MKISVNEPSFDFIKTDIFNFPVCKIYLGTWARRARRARRARGHVGQIGHVGTLGTPFIRLLRCRQNEVNFTCMKSGWCSIPELRNLFISNVPFYFLWFSVFSGIKMEHWKKSVKIRLLRSSRSQMFFKIGALKMFTGK